MAAHTRAFEEMPGAKEGPRWDPNAGLEGVFLYGGLFGRLRMLGRSRLAHMQDVVEDDCPEGGGADAVEGEATERQLEVTGAEDQRDRHGDEVPWIGEVDPVLHPDAPRRRGDEPEH